MAIRSHSEVGQIRGKLGNTITRYRNKKYVVYSVPSQINFSKSKAAVTARKRFAYLVQFAKVINCNSELKEIWKRSSFKGTNAYQKIIKHNSPFISNTGLTKLNFITPSGLGVFSPYINFDVDELFINSSLFNTDRLKPKTFFCLFSIQNQEGANLQLVT